MCILHSVSVDSVSIATGTSLVELPRRLLVFLLIDPSNLLATTTKLITLTIIMMFLIIDPIQDPSWVLYYIWWWWCQLLLLLLRRLILVLTVLQYTSICHHHHQYWYWCVRCDDYSWYYYLCWDHDLRLMIISVTWWWWFWYKYFHQCIMFKFDHFFCYLCYFYWSVFDLFITTHLLLGRVKLWHLLLIYNLSYDDYITLFCSQYKFRFSNMRSVSFGSVSLWCDRYFQRYSTTIRADTDTDADVDTFHVYCFGFYNDRLIQVCYWS